MSERRHYPKGFEIIPDHTEPRQSLWEVFHNGARVNTFDSRFAAVNFVGEQCGESFDDEDEEDSDE